MAIQNIKVSEVEKFLSPTLTQGADKKQGTAAYLGKVFSNIGEMALVKFARIVGLFSKGEWVNNKAVMKNLEKDISSLAGQLKTTKNDLDRDMIGKGTQEMKAVCELLKKSGAKEGSVIELESQLAKLESSVLTDKGAAKYEREAHGGKLMEERAIHRRDDKTIGKVKVPEADKKGGGVETLYKERALRQGEKREPEKLNVGKGFEQELTGLIEEQQAEAEDQYAVRRAALEERFDKGTDFVEKGPEGEHYIKGERFEADEIPGGTIKGKDGFVKGATDADADRVRPLKGKREALKGEAEQIGTKIRPDFKKDMDQARDAAIVRKTLEKGLEKGPLHEKTAAAVQKGPEAAPMEATRKFQAPKPETAEAKSARLARERVEQEAATEKFAEEFPDLPVGTRETPDLGDRETHFAKAAEKYETASPQIKESREQSVKEESADIRKTKEREKRSVRAEKEGAPTKEALQDYRAGELKPVFSKGETERGEDIGVVEKFSKQRERTTVEVRVDISDNMNKLIKGVLGDKEAHASLGKHPLLRLGMESKDRKALQALNKPHENDNAAKIGKDFKAVQDMIEKAYMQMKPSQNVPEALQKEMRTISQDIETLEKREGGQDVGRGHPSQIIEF